MPILCAQSVIINKISASELRRKFIKSALLVGCHVWHFTRRLRTDVVGRGKEGGGRGRRGTLNKSVTHTVS